MSVLTGEDIKRLSQLSGESDLECWHSQMFKSEERIKHMIDGDFQSVFALCLPIWLDTGRVRDRSWGIRTPKYWPRYSKFLGDEFARKFRSHYVELIDLLASFSPQTSEYLCVCDLIEAVMHEFWASSEAVPASIFQIKAAVPEVIKIEFEYDKRFLACMIDLGCFLKRLYDIEYVN